MGAGSAAGGGSRQRAARCDIERRRGPVYPRETPAAGQIQPFPTIFAAAAAILAGSGVISSSSGTL